jgi:pimeloyl-ACP methyl ester carboxylesterase
VRAFLRQLPRPSREEVLPDCGHFPFLEAPDAFARLVKSFLATLC